MEAFLDRLYITKKKFRKINKIIAKWLNEVQTRTLFPLQEMINLLPPTRNIGELSTLICVLNLTEPARLTSRSLQISFRFIR